MIKYKCLVTTKYIIICLNNFLYCCYIIHRTEFIKIPPNILFYKNENVEVMEIRIIYLTNYSY